MENKGGTIVIALFVAIAATLLFIPEISKFFGGQKRPPLVLEDKVGGKSTPSKVSASEELDEEGRADGPTDDGSPKVGDDALLNIPPEDSDEFPGAESFSKVMGQIEEGDVELGPLGINPQKSIQKGKSDGDVQEVTPSAVGNSHDDQERVEADIRNLEEVAKKSGAEGSRGEASADLSLERIGEPPIPPARKAEREELRKILLNPGVDWKVLQDPRVQKPLEGAYKDSNALLKVIGAKYPRSRFALLTYINALSSLLKRTVPGMDFKELLQYIGVLDVRVTQSFIEERIPRTEYYLWRAISVGAFVELAGGKNEFDYLPQFSADLILTRLGLRIIIDRNRQRSFELQVGGVVEGKEPTRIEVFKGKDIIKIIELGQPFFKDGMESYRKFQFSHRDTAGNKPYSFRVMDTKGNVLQKTYSLVAMPMKKFPADSTGTLTIPVVPEPRPIARPSSILDNILVLGSQGSSSEARRKVASGGEVLQYSIFDRRIEKLKKF